MAAALPTIRIVCSPSSTTVPPPICSSEISSSLAGSGLWNFPIKENDSPSNSFYNTHPFHTYLARFQSTQRSSFSAVHHLLVSSDQKRLPGRKLRDRDLLCTDVSLSIARVLIQQHVDGSGDCEHPVERDDGLVAENRAKVLQCSIRHVVAVSVSCCVRNAVGH